MLVLTYSASVVAFCVSFYLVRVVSTCMSIVAAARTSISTIRDPDLDDERKEKATQAAAIAMVRDAATLVGKFLVVAVATAVPAWAGEASGVVTAAEIAAYALRIDVLVWTTIAVTAVVFAGRKLLGK